MRTEISLQQSGKSGRNQAESPTDPQRYCILHSISQSEGSGQAGSQEKLFMFDFFSINNRGPGFVNYL